MTALPSADPSRAYLFLSVGMVISLTLLINLSFNIILLHGWMFSTSSVISAFVTFFYLMGLNSCSRAQQRHLLNQSLFALYLFSIGICLLVNLPAAEYMHNNPAYQVIYIDIPKKFFAATLAFGLSFYLPHLFLFRLGKYVDENPVKNLVIAILYGLVFFNLNFFLLFLDPAIDNFSQIYSDSLLVNASILFVLSLVYLLFSFFKSKLKWQLKTRKPLAVYLRSPLYSYLVCFSVTLLLICLACEYRLISFSNGWTLVASGLFFPLIMGLSNLIGELYGYRANLRLTAILILADLFFDLAMMATVALPTPDFFNLKPFYLSIMPRRIPAGVLAILITLLTNTFLLEGLRHCSLGEQRYLRMLIANILSATLLCLVTNTLLFGGVYPYEEVFNIIIGGWMYKLIATALCLPPTLWLYKRYKTENPCA